MTEAKEENACPGCSAVGRCASTCTRLASHSSGSGSLDGMHLCSPSAGTATVQQSLFNASTDPTKWARGRHPRSSPSRMTRTAQILWSAAPSKQNQGRQHASCQETQLEAVDGFNANGPNEPSMRRALHSRLLVSPGGSSCLATAWLLPSK